LLECEGDGKYKKYKNNLKVIVTGIKKCDCPLKFHDKPIYNGE